MKRRCINVLDRDALLGGPKWAQHIHANRPLVGLAMVALGLALVGVAALLGG